MTTSRTAGAPYATGRSWHLPIFSGVAMVFFVSASAANQVADQVTNLTETRRQVLFSRMLQSSGEKCPAVSRTFYQGSSPDGSAFWSVSCVGGVDWQVMIKNTARGDTKVIECSVLRAVGGGRCFTRFKP